MSQGLKTLGLLGAGNTAGMLAQAARRRGMNCIFLDPGADTGAGALRSHIRADWDDAAALEALARRANLVSVEPETAPSASASALAAACPVYPPAETLALSQDRLLAKQLMHSLQIPVTPFMPVTSRPQLLQAVEQLGLPCMLKTRRPASDGKQQAVLRFNEDLERAWQQLGDHDLVCERYVSFEAEYALAAVCGSDGSHASWPLTRKLHRNGALAVSMAPVEDAQMRAKAEKLAARLLERLEHVGVMVLEFFAAGGDLLVNEFVPAPHDAACWTIDGASTSQFENHLNALCGEPLADTGLLHRALTFHLTTPPPGETLRRGLPENIHWHVYHEDVRPGCKIGHVTVTAESEAGLRARAVQLAGLLGVGAELDLEAILT